MLEAELPGFARPGGAVRGRDAREERLRVRQLGKIAIEFIEHDHERALTISGGGGVFWLR